jgi:hypothetical protein
MSEACAEGCAQRGIQRIIIYFFYYQYSLFIGGLQSGQDGVLPEACAEVPVCARSRSTRHFAHISFLISSIL